MNTSFERKAASDEWYTPKDLVDSLGEFDLDPCAPVKRLWDTAKKHFTKEDDGLSKDWEGKRVWLNPPYSKPLIDLFVKKMAENNNGIALLYNRCDNVMFQEVIFKKASGIFFMRKRVKFYRPDGTQGGSPGTGSVLVAFGESNAKVLENLKIPGKFIRL